MTVAIGNSQCSSHVDVGCVFDRSFPCQILCFCCFISCRQSIERRRQSCEHSRDQSFSPALVILLLTPRPFHRAHCGSVAARTQLRLQEKLSVPRVTVAKIVYCWYVGVLITPSTTVLSDRRSYSCDGASPAA
jgi:hypothetical protein